MSNTNKSRQLNTYSMCYETEKLFEDEGKDHSAKKVNNDEMIR